MWFLGSGVLFAGWGWEGLREMARVRGRWLGLGVLGMPAAVLFPQSAREKGFSSNLLLSFN
jgi:hypothetical protein